MLLEGQSEAPIVVHTCFDEWDRTIAEARKRGYFTDDERKRALDWNYCYVGSAREAFGIEYHPSSMHMTGPTNWTLGWYGSNFSAAVSTNDFYRAERAAQDIKEYLCG